MGKFNRHGLKTRRSTSRRFQNFTPVFAVPKTRLVPAPLALANTLLMKLFAFLYAT